MPVLRQVYCLHQGCMIIPSWLQVDIVFQDVYLIFPVLFGTHNYLYPILFKMPVGLSPI